MSNTLRKELKLCASILSYLFIAFGLMFFLPGYPVLCGPFFVCLGIFQSFQNAREANDLVFSALLPISKQDVVKGKMEFVCFIELSAFSVMLIATLIRMTLLNDAPVYNANALMNANPFALGMALIIFGLFNLIFVAGFFRTAYKFGRPFVSFIIATFVIIGIAEALHHIPGLEALNSFGFDNLPLQLMLLLGGAAIYAILTLSAFKISCKEFKRIDL